MSSYDDDPISISRRKFVGCSVSLASCLLIGFTLPEKVRGQEAPPTPPTPPANPAAFIKIDPNGRVTLMMPYAEMGQGVYTSQVQLIAEELDVEPSTVLFEAAPPNDAIYANPLIGEQVTGGSTALRGQWVTLRQAGAAAREMLVSAAAKQWAVPESDCEVRNGMVVEKSAGRTLGYGELAKSAALLPVPSSPKLKKQENFRFIGKPVRRVDTPSKVDGSALYGIDVVIPGMSYAVVKACPVFNGKLASVNDTNSFKIKGVRKIVKLDNAVAVVADNTWSARKGLDALDIKWNEGSLSTLSIDKLMADADSLLSVKGIVHSKEGDVDRSTSTAKRKYEFDFRQPILAHAAMEPLSCTVNVKKTSCDVWLGSQVLSRAHREAARAADLSPEKVNTKNYYLGGGFGRRLETDYVPQAVLIGKQVDGPVKVTWTREEDMQHDYYRYLNYSRVQVGVDGKGYPVSWRHRVIGPNVMERFLPINTKDGVDLDIVECAYGPYDIPNIEVEYTRLEPPVGMGVGNWRGVGPTRNVCVVESVIEELAHKAGIDPIAYRLEMMISHPRPRAVLQLAAEKAGWGKKLPKRSGLGAAVFSGFGSHLAFIAQTKLDPSGKIYVEKIVCAIDTGIVVNPDVVKAQMEGGIIFGITAALYGKITIENGQVKESNFDTYPVLRMNEAPDIEVYIVESGEDPGGVGEPGTTGAIAAVVNAVSTAAEVRILSLPIDQSLLREV